MRKNLLRSAALITAGAFVFVTMNSNNTGQFQSSQSGCGSNGGCHGVASTATSVTLSGLPATIQPNTTYTVGVVVSNVVKMFSGFNFTASLGTVAPQDNTKVIVDALNVEATHKQPNPATGGVTTNNVLWTSPSTFPNGEVVFYAAGNAVNALNNTTGDEWNKMSLTVPGASPNSINAETQIRVAVYPTVTTNTTTIAADGIESISVFNLAGAQVFTTNVNKQSHYNLDATAFAAGEYIVKGMASGKRFTTRFAKQ
ncbi:MAG: hypothetical protein RL660_112 [Bacteroidota bacterium]|jgi:hypothetical protein